MSQLKAIDTEYGGRLYRSRLEARWAVFFDAMKIRYEYEAEGYNLDGLYYLPDFYLPDLKVYVEIKPARELEEVELDKVLRLQQTSGKRVLLIIGSPGLNSYLILTYSNIQSDAAEVWESEFAECRKGCGEIWLLAKDRSWGGTIVNNPDCQSIDDPVAEYSPRIVEAYRTATMARFEHDAKGAAV